LKKEEFAKKGLVLYCEENVTKLLEYGHVGYWGSGGKFGKLLHSDGKFVKLEEYFSNKIKTNK
jgi:hypothetical protein